MCLLRKKSTEKRDENDEKREKSVLSARSMHAHHDKRIQSRSKDRAYKGFTENYDLLIVWSKNEKRFHFTNRELCVHKKTRFHFTALLFCNPYQKRVILKNNNQATLSFC